MIPMAELYKVIFLYTGGVKIIGRNSQFFNYFITKAKKKTVKNT